MTDYVISLPLRMGEESQAFGDYFSRFVESWSTQADADGEAPFVMLRSDPGLGRELKTVIFQEGETAAAFSSGWAEARLGRLARGRPRSA